MNPRQACTDRRGQGSLNTIFLLLTSFTVLVAFFSCKLDVNAMRQDTLSKIGGSEKMFFLEQIASNTVDMELSQLARESARFGYVEVTRYLQGRGADLNQSDSYGWSPILIACSRGDLPLLRYLVEIAGTDVRARTRTKSSTLMLAARTGSLEVCRYLLDRGVNVDTKSSHGMTALMYAAGSSNIGLARLLVESGADTQVIDRFGNNAFSYAGDQAMKEYLGTLGLKTPAGQ